MIWFAIFSLLVLKIVKNEYCVFEIILPLLLVFEGQGRQRLFGMGNFVKQKKLCYHHHGNVDLPQILN